MFITFEGPEGSGKTTQVTLLVDRLRGEGAEVMAVHEPGGTDLGTDVRALLLRRHWTPIAPAAEALLFSACRAQLVAEVIRPALARGTVVISDRFADSTIAYQGAGRGLPPPDLEAIIRVATGGLTPDLTLLLDIPPQLGIERLQNLGKASTQSPIGQLAFFEALRLREDWTRFEDEALSFHQRVREAYLNLAAAEPRRWVVLDARQTVEAIGVLVWTEVHRRLSDARSALR